MPPLRFEIISALFELGTASPPDATVDPSSNALLRQGGVGLVTAHIEQLTLIDLLRDPMPLFGADGGMWIGYRLTDQGRVAGRSEAALRQAVGALIGGPRNEVSQTVAELEAECQQADINPNYRADFLRTLEQIPVPSRDQAIMVIFATRDVVRRTLVMPAV
ncbi:MAG: hypothetical protein HQ461_00180 [Deltaproteobacteria bacterium]|nr:hypothetical protein [Deltaproteobacteria bacterium]